MLFRSPLDRFSVVTALQSAREKQEILTGLLYVDPDAHDLHDLLETSERPLNSLVEEDLCPGSALLEKINSGKR